MPAAHTSIPPFLMDNWKTIVSDAAAERIEVMDDAKAGAEPEDVANSFTDDEFRKAVRDELKLEENAPVINDACEKC